MTMTMPMQAGPNVATDPLIPVLGPDGLTHVSLADALIDGHRLKGLSLEQPLAVLPIVRIMAALVLRVFQPTTGNIQRLWDAGQFSADPVRRYLVECRDRFELFHPDHPFLQVGGLLPASGPPKGTSGLLLQVATGNNVPLFSPYTEADTIPLSPADALLGLLVTLGWDTAGIKTGAAGDPRVSGGKTAGNPTGPLGQLGAVLPLGRNLFETILLNVPLGPQVDGDRPTWERDLSPVWEVRQPIGPMEWLTWPSRRVRLVPDPTGESVVAAVIAAGDRVSFTPMFEPHTRWRATKGDVVAQRPRRWPPGTQAWRGLDTLLTLAHLDSDVAHDAGAPPRLIDQLRDEGLVLDPSYPLNLLCLGVAYGNMSAVVEDVFVDTLPLPVAALRGQGHEGVAEAIHNVTASAEKVRRSLNGLADNLRTIAGAPKLPWDAGVHPGNDAMALLTQPTRRFLAGLQREPHRYGEGLLAWQQVAEQVAWSFAQPMLDQAPPQTFVGREVKTGATERRVRLADCEAWFRKGLHDALPALYQSRTQQREER
nr:type I-E CRISPR-associated protein Cse1/CasA [Propionibacterium sp.]